MLHPRPVEAVQVEPIVSANKHTKQLSVAETEAARLARIGITTEMLTLLTRERRGRLTGAK